MRFRGSRADGRSLPNFLALPCREIIFGVCGTVRRCRLAGRVCPTAPLLELSLP